MTHDEQCNIYVDGSYEAHLHELKKNGTWGTDAEIHAASKIYKRQVFVRLKRNGKKEWHPYHVTVGEVHNCDHGTDYIAMDYQSTHFQVVQTRERPLCQCNKRNTRPETEKAKRLQAVTHQKLMEVGMGSVYAT